MVRYLVVAESKSRGIFKAVGIASSREATDLAWKGSPFHGHVDAEKLIVPIDPTKEEAERIDSATPAERAKVALSIFPLLAGQELAAVTRRLFEIGKQQQPYRRR